MNSFRLLKDERSACMNQSLLSNAANLCMNITDLHIKQRFKCFFFGNIKRTKQSIVIRDIKVLEFHILFSYSTISNKSSTSILIYEYIHNPQFIYI